MKKIYSILRTEGIIGLFSVVFHRAFPRRLAYYQYCKPRFHGKVGLEIGGPSGIFKRHGLLPVYRVAAGIDNVNFGHKTVWEGVVKEGATFRYDNRRAEGNQYVAEATNLRQIASASYDFVLSSHTLEHIANPLQALSEWTRTLKEDGLLVLVVPHKDGTFDHRRPVTSLAHLIQDFDQKLDEGDLTHVGEILRLHDLAKDPGGGDFDEFKQRSYRNLEHRCLHHHVFDTRLAVELINHMGLQILAVEIYRPYDILIIAQKPMTGKGVLNSQFRGINSTPSWHSPFKSDQDDHI